MQQPCSGSSVALKLEASGCEWSSISRPVQLNLGYYREIGWNLNRVIARKVLHREQTKASRATVHTGSCASTVLPDCQQDQRLCFTLSATVSDFNLKLLNARGATRSPSRQSHYPEFVCLFSAVNISYTTATAARSMACRNSEYRAALITPAGSLRHRRLLTL